MKKITMQNLEYLLGILGTVCCWFHAYCASEVFLNLIQLEREKVEKPLTYKSKKRPQSEYGIEYKPVKKRTKKHEGVDVLEVEVEVHHNLSEDIGGSYQFPIGIFYSSHFVIFSYHYKCLESLS